MHSHSPSKFVEFWMNHFVKTIFTYHNAECQHWTFFLVIRKLHMHTSLSTYFYWRRKCDLNQNSLAMQNAICVTKTHFAIFPHPCTSYQCQTPKPTAFFILIGAWRARGVAVLLHCMLGSLPLKFLGMLFGSFFWG